MGVWVCMCVCVYVVGVRVCMCACVSCVCVHTCDVCVCVCACVRANGIRKHEQAKGRKILNCACRSECDLKHLFMAYSSCISSPVH